MLLPNPPHPRGVRLLGVYITAQNVYFQCLKFQSQRNVCVTLIVYTCSGLYVRTLRWGLITSSAALAECLGVWCERDRGYSQTDVPVRTDTQKACGLKSQTSTLWAFSCGLFCGRAEFKTKVLSHFPCRVVFLTCRLVAVASMLGILLFLLYQSLFHPLWFSEFHLIFIRFFSTFISFHSFLLSRFPLHPTFT